MKHICQPRWNVIVLALAFAVLAVAQGSISPAQDTTERPWFERSLVGMEVGPTGAQFGYSDPEDTRYCKDWDGREIVQKCVEANADGSTITTGDNPTLPQLLIYSF